MNSVSFYFGWEVRLMEFLQKGMGPFGTAAASFFTMFGEEIILAAILFYIYLCRDKEFGKVLGLNLIIGTVWNPMIKNVFFRRRPYFDHPEIRCLRKVSAKADALDIKAQGYSFPSGHSTNAVTAFGTIALHPDMEGKRRKRVEAAAGVLIFLVGLSRVLLGVHYPTDVLTGWVLGFLIILFLGFLRQKIRDRRILYALLLAVSLTGVFYCRTEEYFAGLGLLTGMLLSFLFEERFVNFEKTSCIQETLLRTLGAAALFGALTFLLKKLFSVCFPDPGTGLEMFLRVVRYGVMAFVIFGLYPMLFRPVRDRFLRKEDAQK